MARKTGLGKGLDALIPGGNFGQASSNSNEIPVEKIIPNPHQPRSIMDDEDLNELAASIREHGILQPLIVTYDGGSDTYVLIAGERRLRAARLANLDFVPAIIRQVSDQERLELALIENIQREDLSPLEAAEAYLQLSKEFHLSHEEIAVKVGKSRAAVTNTLRLLNLPEKIRQTLLEGKITEGHARALLGLDSSQAQLAVLDLILRNELNVRQTETLVKKYSGERPAKPVKESKLPEVIEVEEKLRTRFGTKVNLNYSKNGGTIVIHYYSPEELEALIEHLLGE
jgi:ParB family chromosome partitioning protein